MLVSEQHLKATHLSRSCCYCCCRCCWLTLGWSQLCVRAWGAAACLSPAAEHTRHALIPSQHTAIPFEAQLWQACEHTTAGSHWLVSSCPWMYAQVGRLTQQHYSKQQTDTKHHMTCTDEYPTHIGSTTPQPTPHLHPLLLCLCCCCLVARPQRSCRLLTCRADRSPLGLVQSAIIGCRTSTRTVGQREQGSPRWVGSVCR